MTDTQVAITIIVFGSIVVALGVGLIRAAVPRKKPDPID